MVNTPALAEVFAHLVSKYPEEGCGVIFSRPDGSLRALPMENVYDRYHARNPAVYPRTNKTAYLFNLMKLQTALEEAETKGEKLHCIFHSHCDVGTYFSSEDVAMAAPDGQPAWPGVAYLVVAVDQGKVTASKLFQFENGQFPEIPMP